MRTCHRFLALVSTALLLAAAGCEGSGGTISLNDYQAQFESALCEKFVACGIEPSVEVCKLGRTERNRFPQIVAGAGAGRAGYDGDAARQCVDTIKHLECSSFSFNSEGAICNKVFTPKVPVAGTCYADEECTTHVCSQVCPGDECCAGKCIGQVPAGEGESCLDAGCDFEHACIEDAATGTATCKPRLAEGAACVPSDNKCQPGLVCPSGTCKRLPDTGESCAGVGQCDDLTQACSPINQTCVARRQPGEACSMQSFQSDCVFYAKCTNGVCEALALLGEDCSQKECVRGTRCGAGVKCTAVDPQPICGQ